MKSNENLRLRAAAFVNAANEIESQQQADIRMKEKLEKSIQIIIDKNKLTSDELNLLGNAIEILRKVSDEQVQASYQFITDNINSTLERILVNSVRKIRLVESTRAGQYPQLEVELTVENGVKRSLKTGSGHGLAQIVSILSILCIIVITHSRKTLWMDEVLSGLSSNSRAIVAEILATFTQIGFQFVICERGFIPKGAKVYHYVMEGGVSRIDDEYVEQNGVYLDETKSGKNLKRVELADYTADGSDETSEDSGETDYDGEVAVVESSSNGVNKIQFKGGEIVQL